MGLDLSGQLRQGLRSPGRYVRARPIARGVGDGIAGHQLEVVGKKDVRVGRLVYRVEREPPPLLAGLQRDSVVVGRTNVFELLWKVAGVGPASPGIAVEFVQDRTAPVALLRGRGRCIEFHTERDIV